MLALVECAVTLSPTLTPTLSPTLTPTLTLTPTPSLTLARYAFVPILIEYAIAYRALGAAGLYVAYVSGAVCKVKG